MLAITASVVTFSTFAYSLLKRQSVTKASVVVEQVRPLLKKQVLEQCILVVPTCYKSTADIRFQICIEFIADALKSGVRLLIVDG
jgi:hypothetical protein